jgi:uroporphyrinogen-III synthase
MIYLLSPAKREGVFNLPMIEFRRIADKIDFNGVDTLIFTSKQAVVTADSIDRGWREFDSIAIGGATKANIEELGGRVIFSPKNFYGKTLAKDILERFRDRKILYLRPKVISFDSKSFLEKNGVSIKEQIIYETTCKSYTKESQPQKGAIIIFTSPSTIRCFFKSFEWDSSYRAVIIGKATKKELPDFIENVEIAERPLIDFCIKKAKKIILS